MPTLRIPLVGSLIDRGVVPSLTTKDQLFDNCYPEVTSNPVTKKGSVVLYKRPGHTSGSALSGVSQSTNGAMVWTGSANLGTAPLGAFLNTGGTSTSVWDLNGSTKVGGDISNTIACVALTETTVSGTPTLVGHFIDSSTQAVEQWVYPEGGAWTQVTDSDFPTDVVGMPAHIGGLVFTMGQNGRVTNSDVNSATSYTANSYFPTNAYPDKGVSVARHADMIVAFGEKSTELLRNTGNPTGSPLSRVTSFQIGAARAYTPTNPLTVLQGHDTVYWVGTDSNGAKLGIFRFKGDAPEKISTPAIDKLITGGTIVGFLGTLTLHGMSHVALRGTSGETWCFCLDTKTWWKLTLAAGFIVSCVATSAAAGHAATYFTRSDNAKANVFTAANQDDGSNFTMTVRTMNIDMGTDRVKFCRGVRVAYDRQASASNLGLAYSDDDYGTTSTTRNIDMSTAQSWLRNLGSFRRRSLTFTNTANTPCRIEAVEIEYEVGSS